MVSTNGTTVDINIKEKAGVCMLGFEWSVPREELTPT